MEFMQWFKAYADSRGGCAPGYDGPERRAHAKTGDVRGGAGAPRSAAAGGAPAGAGAAPRARAAAAAAARDPARVLAAKENAAPGGGAAGEPGGKAAPRPRGDAADAGGACAGRLQELQEQVRACGLRGGPHDAHASFSAGAACVAAARTGARPAACRPRAPRRAPSGGAGGPGDGPEAQGGRRRARARLLLRQAARHRDPVPDARPLRDPGAPRPRARWPPGALRSAS